MTRAVEGEAGEPGRTPSRTGLPPGLVGFGGALVVRAHFLTIRIEIDEDPAFQRLRANGAPVIYVFWHRHILPLTYQHRFRGDSVLVSQHRDGEYIARVLARLGFRTPRGSSTRGGAGGLRALLRDARGPGNIALTPDGPRGPRGVVKEGALLAARLTGRPLVPLAALPSRAWELGSWDGFLVPQPFSAVRIRYGAPILLARRAASADEAARDRLRVQGALDALEEPDADVPTFAGPGGDGE